MRKWHNKVWVSLISCAMLILCFISAPSAYAVSHGSRVLSEQTTVVPIGTNVEDAVVLGHDVTVAGTVSEILIVVNGNIHLVSSARTGIMVDIGGTVTQDAGAKTEDMYQFSEGSYFWNGVLLGAVGALLVWVGMLAASIAGVLMSVLLSLALRTRNKIPLTTVERSVRRTGLIGLFVTVAAIAIGALFAMVDIGIPLAVLILLLYILTGIIGFSIVSLWFGKLIMQGIHVEKPIWLQTLIGASAIMVSVNIPIIGLVLFSVFWMIGIGAITVWVSYMWRRRDIK